jgi:hypothetical protein
MKLKLTRNRINYKTLVVIHDASGPPDLDKIKAQKEKARKDAKSLSASPTTDRRIAEEKTADTRTEVHLKQH